MPKASVIVPAYNVAATLGETLRALLDQTYGDFEIVVVDDGSSDRTAAIARGFGDPRIRLVQQPNRGLAGARNSGIHAARGDFIGFCDADDLWRPTKLADHVAHLEAHPHVGLSFSGSELIDEAGHPTGLAQRPRLRGITPAHIFRRNPVGNGSAPVLRRAALEAIAFRPAGEERRDWWFDERFRQSEDIECWLRLALSTDWEIEGIPGLLTRYRVASGGLSAGVERQYASWEAMVAKLTPLAPEFIARHAPAARAYQHRYLARRAISAGDRPQALARLAACFAASPRPLLEEPVKTLSTLAAGLVLATCGPRAIDRLRGLAARRPAPRRPA
ncbi:glycosyltransferase family 2 protein [Pseudodonghicola flavimaris]|uniref:Glycosyltransferase family A protein n=1 Tax=Pseudodonghicola flavimaris TaxID=3050036 RepID=A0ABT7F6A7_9RHOB|nr:glycosyltransferase family A protein [Pseudodonghicola flavimaris]MDK3020147.1 glycosyltransferase family A protein [Pseudodonghicola flavimaris]